MSDARETAICRFSLHHSYFGKDFSDSVCSLLKPQSHIHDFGPGRATVNPDLANRLNRGESGWKRRKSSLKTVPHDAPTVSARFVRFKPVAPRQRQDLLRMCTI